MAFLVGSVKLKVYTDSAETEFPKEMIADIEKTLESDSISSAQMLTISIAAAGSQTVNLNGVGTVTRIYMYSSANINANFNGLGNISWKGMVPGLAPLAVTSLVLANPGAESATVTVILIED